MKLPAHKKMLSAAAAASVLLITAACGSSSSDSDGAAAPSSTTSAPAASDPTTEAPSTTSDYKDGDYSGEGSYSNPGGVSPVKVDVTLAAGKITAIEVTPEATDPTSKSHQEDFAGGISAEVVGKSIDDLNVGAVAGSSLTAEGFNKAIDQIKDEAKA